MVAAIRIHARTSGDLERARIALESMAGVRWDAGGAELPARPDMREAAIGLADVLMAMGREKQGRQLLGAILGRMDHEIRKEGRTELWYQKSHSIALALDNQPEEAIAMLQRSVIDWPRMNDCWFHLRAGAGLRRAAPGPALPGNAADRVHERRGAAPRSRPAAC